MKQFDVIRISKDDPKKGIIKGQVGTILEIYNENYFEIEIVDNNGNTIFLDVISGDFIEGV